MSATTGTFGYLWLKCVSSVRNAPALDPTSTASRVSEWRLESASLSRASSKVASWIRTVALRAAWVHGWVCAGVVSAER